MDQAAGARITAQGWGFRYPGRSSLALSDVSFTIEPGELVVLMGASGSGKSTLLAALAGTLPEGGHLGQLHVLGSAEGEAPRVGLVQQEPEGNIVMERVGDDVAFPLESAAVPAPDIWPRVAGALAPVGLTVPLDRSTARLSGGQQQLLAVAAASVADPHLLLLDEPTANLDPAAAAGVLAAVEAVRARRGCTVVVVEHRVEAWLARADRVLVADGGSVTALAPADLAAHLRSRSGARVWVDHTHLPSRVPTAPPGERVLAAHGLAVADRLPETDLELRAGEVLAITGPPGAGKSTLLACLAGLLTPTSGTVQVRGPGSGVGGPRTDPWRWASADIAGTFGVVFQNPEHQFVTGRVVDEVQHGLVVGVGAEQAEGRAARMLERLHLTHLAQADPFTLSGGEQRRLSVGTALAQDPGILLLDEPTFGQDPATWAELVDIIADHRDAGGAVVMATHDPDLVRSLAAREVRLGGARPGSGGADPDAFGLSTLYGRQPEPLSTVTPEVGGVVLPVRSGSSAAGSLPSAPAAGLRRLDPLALLGAAMLLSAAALVSSSIGLNLALALIAVLAGLLGGVPTRRVALLATPALAASLSVAFSNALLSADGLAAASSWSAAALPASRVLAVALPGLVAAVAIDPTGLADALVVRLRVPVRPAYSALAGLRLLPLLSDEWAVLGRASRARGLEGSGIRARVSQFASMTFRLLVAALRRGGRLAVALDARGLRPEAPRTVARPVRWAGRDTVALVLAAAALVVALATRL
jgi:energy-coupling factor transport system ATP-binding protein